MILDIVESIDGVPIRLTDERWEHILIGHPLISGYYERILSTIENPTFILCGNNRSKIAVNNYGRKLWLHVAYREVRRDDGFIITAYIKKDYNENLVIWQSIELNQTMVKSSELLKLAKERIRIPSKYITLNYQADVDLLFIKFTNGISTYSKDDMDKGIIYNYDENSELVSVEILDLYDIFAEV